MNNVQAIPAPLSLAQIKAEFPDEWVLLGNPVMDEGKLNVISGIPLYHSKDKKEVCYLGKEKTGGFQEITLIFTGERKHAARVITGIFNRVNPVQA